MNLVDGINDSVNHPAHYTQGGIECIDAIEAAVTDLSGIEAVLTGQVLKYMWRWKLKNGIEDLEKAQWYLNRLLQHVDDKNLLRNIDLEKLKLDPEQGCMSYDV